MKYFHKIIKSELCFLKAEEATVQNWFRCTTYSKPEKCAADEENIQSGNPNALVTCTSEWNCSKKITIGDIMIY